MAEIKQFAKTTITDLRSAIWGLSKDITVRDFEMKIASEIQKAQQDNLSVELDFTSDYGGNLNSITAVNALRIVQEALQNALKHANATVIEIVVVMGEGNLQITIRDNGKGIQNKGNGFGLRFMEQRAEKMGATLSVESSEEGTVIKLMK